MCEIIRKYFIFFIGNVYQKIRPEQTKLKRIRKNKNKNYLLTKCTSLSVVMGQRYIIPIMGQSVFVENGRDDDRINNCAFI